MKYPLLVLIVIFSMLCNVSSLAQKDSDSVIIVKAIHKNGLAFLKNKNITSASIGIFKDGKTYIEHFGELEKGQGNPPNDQTIYEIGSVTKTMTGYLVAKAVLEEKLNLDDPITMFLTGDYSNLEYHGKSITIKNLLTHTSVLPMFLPMNMNGVFEQFNENVPNDYFELEKSYDKQKFLEDLKKVSLTAEPGTSYSYSNAGAELIGYVLEKIYQKSLDELLKDSFLTGSGMHDTAIELSEIQKQKLVRGYWMDNETLSPNQLNTLWASGSGAKMTILDMMRYIDLQLKIQDPIVSESHKVLFKDDKTLKLAYFWSVWNDKYGTSYNHHGGTSGTQNWLFIFPNYNLGISIITNQSGPKTPNELSKTAKKLLKAIIND